MPCGDRLTAVAATLAILAVAPAKDPERATAKFRKSNGFEVRRGRVHELVGVIGWGGVRSWSDDEEAGETLEMEEDPIQARLARLCTCKNRTFPSFLKMKIRTVNSEDSSSHRRRLRVPSCLAPPPEPSPNISSISSFEEDEEVRGVAKDTRILYETHQNPISGTRKIPRTSFRNMTTSSSVGTETEKEYDQLLQNDDLELSSSEPIDTNETLSDFDTAKPFDMEIGANSLFRSLALGLFMEEERAGWIRKEISDWLLNRLLSDSSVYRATGEPFGHSVFSEYIARVRDCLRTLYPFQKGLAAQTAPNTLGCLPERFLDSNTDEETTVDDNEFELFFEALVSPENIRRRADALIRTTQNTSVIAFEGGLLEIVAACHRFSVEIHVWKRWNLFEKPRASIYPVGLRKGPFEIGLSWERGNWLAIAPNMPYGAYSGRKAFRRRKRIDKEGNIELLGPEAFETSSTLEREDGELVEVDEHGTFPCIRCGFNVSNTNRNYTHESNYVRIQCPRCHTWLAYGLQERVLEQ